MPLDPYKYVTDEIKVANTNLSNERRERNTQLAKAAGATVIAAASLYYHGELQTYGNELADVPIGDYIADKIPFVASVYAVYDWVNSAITQHGVNSTKRVIVAQTGLLEIMEEVNPVIKGGVISSTIDPGEFSAPSHTTEAMPQKEF